MFTGGEHAVFESEGKTAIVKHTLPGFYGRLMDESVLLDSRTFQMRRKLTMRGALPSEYLRRWAVLHAVFGIPTTYLGTTGMDVTGLQMAVVQPYIEQDDSDPAEIHDVVEFMTGHGFTKVDPGLIAIPEVAAVTWYRQRDGLLITDAHARNFRKDINGVIIPVDLVVTPLPKGMTQVLPEPLSEWAVSD